ncbi:hypothetical protein CgunFtcFv8_015958 [Champsocephalus gunnari]|uniref:Uncharacterized protein n=1 Tax=Champsocephalus gunnari TaxID=52237 RepID=A0AAN8H189_CHAGU|nr:hypothetical protein CgunFtcFv8_015958 [Champsocephalus gunnari]
MHSAARDGQTREADMKTDRSSHGDVEPAALRPEDRTLLSEHVFYRYEDDINDIQVFCLYRSHLLLQV